ncbi:MAG: hypothetical protein JJE52_08035 [Acidimicrobiia bacterium]|nr:hypothetical protein [Acidimicrobiia bacterium]
MGANRTTFEKLQRDRAKKAKAAAKRDRRLGVATPDAPATDSPESEGAEWSVGESEEPLSAPELLKLVEQLQAQFDSKSITFEEYEERKIDLLARISVD